jgi:hypothetical protein
MAEPKASPRLIKFVRRALRRDRSLTYEVVLQRWRAGSPEGPADDVVRRVYDEELAALTTPRAADPGHNRLVLGSAAAWILANALLVLAIGLRGYLSCRQGGSSTTLGCGFGFGMLFLIVGVAQLLYGAVVAAIAYRIWKPVAQGVLIGMGATTVLFTALCFGATVSG